jgi:hypothetical protein
LDQDKIKIIFDRHTKEDDFKVNNFVLKRDARNENRGRHGKFHHIWMGPFEIDAYHGKNSYCLQEINEDLIFGGTCEWKVSQTLSCLEKKISLLMSL